MKFFEDLKRSLGFGFSMACIPIYRSLLAVLPGSPEILSGVAKASILVASWSGVKLLSLPSNTHKAPAG